MKDVLLGALFACVAFVVIAALLTIGLGGGG